MNIKFLLPVLALSLTVASCSKENTTTVDSTMDSMNVPAQDSTMSALPQVDSLQNATPMTYISNDGKTTFSVDFDSKNGTAVVKNETDGKSYTMKQTESASGEKFVDADGYYFIGHQGDFYFGKDDKDIVTGKRK